MYSASKRAKKGEIVGQNPAFWPTFMKKNCCTILVNRTTYLFYIVIPTAVRQTSRLTRKLYPFIICFLFVKILPTLLAIARFRRAADCINYSVSKQSVVERHVFISANWIAV